MHKKYYFLQLLILALSTLLISCSMNNKKGLASEPAIDLKNMDTTVSPGTDFYQYVNGNWMKNNPIPSTKSRFGAFDKLDEDNDAHLHDLVLEISKKTGLKKGSNEQKVGDFFASGMDSVKIDKLGTQPLKPYLDKVNSISDSKSLSEVCGFLQASGISPFFYFYGDQDSKHSENVIPWVYQGGLGLPDRDYYFDKEQRFVKIRSEYLKHVEKMLTMLGDKQKDAGKNAATIMKIESSLAKASMTRLEQRDPNHIYHIMSQTELEKISKNFSWKLFYEQMGYSNKFNLNVAQPDFIINLDKLLKDISIEDWKVFLRWKIVDGLASYLSSEFVAEDFNFHGKVLSGKKENEERWKRILNTTSYALGEAIGQIYVEKYFSPDAKKRMLDLVENLRKAYAVRIKSVSWMSNETKDKALDKLNSINVKIGYPDKWRDYSKLEISRDSYLENVLNANRFETIRNLNKIGKPVDKSEWGMTPQTVNAYYNPSLNEIVFPAAILQPPFFNVNADDAVNYGAIGVVIGHEMTHGFDDQGRLFDKNGNLSDWWTPKDATEYKKMTKLLVDQYSAFTVIDSFKINGELTLGENIADYGGLTISYTALQMALKEHPQKDKIDGFTPDQRFFIGYAQVWRQNIRNEELMRRVKEDVHSPGKFRVNGGVVNIPAFYTAFGIKETDPIFRKAELRPAIW